MEYLTSKQMAKVDKLVIEDYHLKITQMMENAGRNVARWIVDELKPKKVIIFFGKGNNGGDGLCCARFLRIYGVKNITIIQADKNKNSEVKHQLMILRKMGIIPSENFSAEKGDVVVDALLGYNIDGNPREKFAELIDEINLLKQKGVKVVSYDLPSGMNPNNGNCFKPCVKPDYTMTLALPKKGLKNNKKIGKQFLVNIGIPNEIYKNELGINIKNHFSKKDIIKIINNKNNKNKK